MPILDILKESLLSEKLPLSVARDFVKKGRKNAEHLPDEFIDAYAEMFGNKNRIHIGNVKISNTDEQFVELDIMLEQLIKTIEANIHRDAEFPLMAMIQLHNKIRRDNPQAIDIAFTPRDIESRTAAEKQLSQAKLPNGGYLLKTVIKRLKPYILPEAYAKIQQMTGQLLTKASNIRMVDSAPVILSKHAYDIAGMSQGKRWKSCKKAIEDESGPQGCNAYFLDSEVGHILIAFIANPTLGKGRDMLSDPYARLLVLPVESGGDYGLYVSTDIYDSNDHSGINSPINREFHTVVTNYVSNFMPVFDDSDDKEMVGKYYPDSNFIDIERQEELRWEAWEEGYNYIDRKLTYAPSEFMDLIKELFSMEMLENIDIDDIAEHMRSYVAERELIDIDDMFEHMKELGIDRSDYVDTYIGTDGGDLDRFLEGMKSESAEDKIRDYILNNPSEISFYQNLEYLIDKDILVDGVLDFVEYYAIKDDSTIMEENGKFAGAFVNYVLRHENAEPWINSDDWKRNTDIVTMWQKIENVDTFEEFYGFLRLTGYTHDEIMSVFEDLEDLDEGSEEFWDKRLSEKEED